MHCNAFAANGTGREGGDGSAQRGRSVIYDGLVATSHAGAVGKCDDEYVCLCVCLSVCVSARISGTTHAIFAIFVHVAYIRGSVLLRHVAYFYHILAIVRH